MSSLTDLSRLENEPMSSYKTRLVSQHILSSIKQASNSTSITSTNAPPLIVGLQGPQGSGKTTLTTSLKEALSSAPHNLNVAIYSLDDLYLPHQALESLKNSNPNNKLLHGRGQPGTHDLALGTKVLQELSNINQSKESLQLPIYDKSLFSGQGDRSKSTIEIKVPPELDVVVFEGWCLGFQPLDEKKLEEIYTTQKEKFESNDKNSSLENSRKPYFLNHSLENLKEINHHLKEFQSNWYSFLKSFVQLLPESESKNQNSDKFEEERGDLVPFGCQTVYKWRLQAEEDMKSKNGGKGMSEVEVRNFVERYFPSYELFSSTLSEISNSNPSDLSTSSNSESKWKGKGLRIVLGSEREVKRAENF